MELSSECYTSLGRLTWQDEGSAATQVCPPGQPPFFENIDISIDIDKVNLKNIDSDKGILQNINIEKYQNS